MVGTPVAANHPLGWAGAYSYSSTSSLCCRNYQAAAAARVRVRVRPPSQSQPQSRSQIGYQKSLLVSELGALRLPSSLSWSGLNHFTPITTPSHSHKEKKKRGKVRGKGKGVYASLFGVGAPEALVIGVVALLVFGPKGLAEVARNLGKTLRAFQPTIRELQDVSKEFKSTLEREIGLDDSASSTNNTYKPTSLPNENQQPMVDPNGVPKSEAYTSEDLLRVTQEASAASAAGPQSQGSSPEGQDVVEDAPSKVSAPTAPESASQIQSSEKAEKEM